MSVFISCGSNIGNRRDNIDGALTRLVRDGQVTELQRSSYYQSSPVDFLDQPEFLNSVVEVETNLDAEELLARIQDIENSVNAPGKLPKGPRCIDLDILLFDDRQCSDQNLSLPHPAICGRRFVLVPLLEIAPELICPVDQRPYRECLEQLHDPSQQVELLHE